MKTVLANLEFAVRKARILCVNELQLKLETRFSRNNISGLAGSFNTQKYMGLFMKCYGRFMEQILKSKMFFYLLLIFMNKADGLLSFDFFVKIRCPPFSEK